MKSKNSDAWKRKYYCSLVITFQWMFSYKNWHSAWFLSISHVYFHSGYNVTCNGYYLHEHPAVSNEQSSAKQSNITSGTCVLHIMQVWPTTCSKHHYYWLFLRSMIRINSGGHLKIISFSKPSYSSCDIWNVKHIYWKYIVEKFH